MLEKGLRKNISQKVKMGGGTGQNVPKITPVFCQNSIFVNICVYVCVFVCIHMCVYTEKEKNRNKMCYYP